jgi:hypothetical protein
MATCGLVEHLVAVPALAQVRGFLTHIYNDLIFMFWTTPPDDEKSCMLLVMRVLSIVPLNFKACSLPLISPQLIMTVFGLFLPPCMETGPAMVGPPLARTFGL